MVLALAKLVTQVRLVHRVLLAPGHTLICVAKCRRASGGREAGRGRAMTGKGDFSALLMGLDRSFLLLAGRLMAIPRLLLLVPLAA